LPKVIKYLDEVEKDIIDNFRRFLHYEDEKHSISALGIELPQADAGIMVWTHSTLQPAS
jgi:hypothetical protein